MATAAKERDQVEGSGGKLLVAALQRHGVDTIFTLSGGHLFPIYDACVAAGVRLVDTRHEQTAVFAAEGIAKLTRRPGVAVVTAGPGVTNAASAVASAQAAGSPLVVVGGRAPAFRWGQGSLQELDHVPVMAPITKRAETVTATGKIPMQVDTAVVAACTPHRGPVFLDAGIDALAAVASAQLGSPPEVEMLQADEGDLARVANLIDDARTPVLLAGTDVYFDEAWEPMRLLAEKTQMPVFTSGSARGTMPAGHPLAYARARGLALSHADLVVVAGTPLDFRLRFGDFGPSSVVHLADAPEQLATHVDLAGSAAGSLARMFDALTELVDSSNSLDEWHYHLRQEEDSRRATDRAELTSAAMPIHPARIYGELEQILDDDAVIMGDGGDFVSFAGRYVKSSQPGRWLDTGPFGCLGSGPGYAIAARLVHPTAQVMLLMGDGAFGFSGLDFDTMVRHQLPVLAVVGNNGIWGLEKHPMRALYGHDVAADLQPECRYDLVVEALGGHGEFVTEPSGIRPAIERALGSNKPALVNVVTDPEVAYPRSTMLV
ncbi:MAG: acetolactate synthase [Acidimicrobiia bacterium]